ncbi:MAG: alpha/beta fold hydrolase [Candidatus Hydrogenedentes bacterium]|nr:alpha/beta fold hydrolase [Candidatus Hydrogenedentota bacterium]
MSVISRSGWSAVALVTVFIWILFAVANVTHSSGMRREPVRIHGPQGNPCLGTVWTCGTPRAVIVLGHGVTMNQGAMATLADTFARNGHAAVAIDFWGHGRSRERFDWSSNAAQVGAWCAWARERFPGLPLAYLGHSMGGEAGDAAFRENPAVDAFVSLGMLPRRVPDCPTLIAFGRYEELFSEETAREVAGDRAEVLVSPYSDHMLEITDPFLVRGIVAWVNTTLGLGGTVAFSWTRWAVLLAAMLIGVPATLVLAEKAASYQRPSPMPTGIAPLPPPGRFNLFRPAARLLGCAGEALPPMSGSMPAAMVRGAVFGVVFAMLMSLLLSANVFTCSLNHPARLAAWLVLALPLAALFLRTSHALERVNPGTAFRRFAVGALTRATPLLVIASLLALRGPGIAFAGMMLAILALVFAFVAAVHALATRGAGDYRAGAVASGIVLAWITAFWLPLVF